MASKVDGFDYDRFFVKYAQLNGRLALYSRELSVLSQDEHPLDYSRTNVPVQQFEEFYETYGVKEGDNMYLAPEDR
ncbi:MAG: M13 family peptidase, partial [Lachnospiraceae bacterium]|nr:M13 family peptidase [Lachnospiraceae bacterium]